ncbi:MAG: flagellar biosynthesis protein FliQ [Hyphomicrobium sp.]
MNASDARELLQLAIWVCLVASAPVVVATMVVGLVVAIFQALTQIQEVTLTFVPKIVIVLVMLVVTAPFMGSQIGVFAQQVYTRIDKAQ